MSIDRFETDVIEDEFLPQPEASISSGAAVTVISQVASALAGGLTTLVVARTLGPSGTGAFGIIIATLAMMTILSGLGLETGAVYHVSRHRWHAGHAVRQLVVAAFVLGLSGMLIAICIGIAARNSAFKGIGLGTLAIGLTALPFALAWIFTSHAELGLGNYRRAAVAPFLQSIVGLVLVALLAPPFGVIGAVGALTASHALASAVVVVRSLRASAATSARWLASAAPELGAAVRFGLKASATAILSLVNQRADLMILNAYATHAVVGQYSVALSLTSMQLLLPYSLSRLVIPRVSSLHAPSVAGARSLIIQKSVRHGLLISVVAAAGMAASLLAVPLVFGSGFAPTVTLGWILVPGTAALGLANVLGATITGSGKPEHLLKSATIVTPLTVALYFVLVPIMKAPGAAVASTISYTLTLAIYWMFFRKVTGIRRIRSLTPGIEEVREYWQLASRSDILD